MILKIIRSKLLFIIILDEDLFLSDPLNYHIQLDSNQHENGPYKQQWHTNVVPNLRTLLETNNASILDILNGVIKILRVHRTQTNLQLERLKKDNRN